MEATPLEGKVHLLKAVLSLLPSSLVRRELFKKIKKKKKRCLGLDFTLSFPVLPWYFKLSLSWAEVRQLNVTKDITVSAEAQALVKQVSYWILPFANTYIINVWHRASHFILSFSSHICKMEVMIFTFQSFWKNQW